METPAQVKRIQALQRAPDSQKRERRFLWLLLLLIPICLWLTAQIALWGLGANQVQDTVLSNMIADYGEWQPQQFSPLKPELIGTIRADQATWVALPGINVLGTIVPFIPLGTGTQIAEVPGATPTSTPTHTPTATETLTNTPFIVLWPTWTPTPTETNTPWPTAVPPVIPPPPLPTVQLSGAANAIDESAGNVTITVTLSAASSQTIAVTYVTSDGTASAPSDYTNTTNVLTFLSGQTILTFDIPIINDALDEADETLQVALSNPVNATLGPPNLSTITILDNDVPCGGVSSPPSYTLADFPLQYVDNNGLDVACGQSVTIDLGSTPIIANSSSETAFDLVIYEFRQTGMNNIEMDWIIIEVRATSADPWLTVFNWGDGGPDANTSLGRNGFSVTEADNESIPMTNPPLLQAPMLPPWDLFTGIGIDVDPLVPPGDYGWIRITAPYFGGNDPAQVDYIEIITP